MKLDLLDVVKKRLEDAGLTNVFTSLVDGRKHPESLTLSFGVPEDVTTYYSLDQSTKVRVTVYSRRLADADAMMDAHEAQHALRLGGLDSLNGSYRFIGIDAGEPRPVLYDESGRRVWVFDCTMTIERMDS